MAVEFYKFTLTVTAALDPDEAKHYTENEDAAIEALEFAADTTEAQFTLKKLSVYVPEVGIKSFLKKEPAVDWRRPKQRDEDGAK